jgi:hypothetical protein
MAGDTLTADQIVKEAHEFWVMARETNRENIASAERDLRFLNNDQWNAKHKKDREDQGRPALVLNVLWPYVNQVSNDYAQADVALEIDPVGDGADEATADVYEGLIRHIEYESDASDARNMRFFYAVACGVGYSRLVTEYEEDDTRNQVIRIERIQDPFSVVMDPYANKLDGSDAQKVLVLDSMTKEAFKERWGDSVAAQQNFYEGQSNPAPEWIGIGPNSGNVQVAEYWKVYGFDATRVQMKDGSLKLESEVTEEDIEYLETGEDGKPLTRTDKTQRRVVQYIVNGAEVLEENEWIGKYIPIIRLVGRELFVKGKRQLLSLIRFAIDAQILVNWSATNEAETLALAPRDTILVTPHEVEGFEQEWQTANEQNLPYKRFNPDPLMGNSRPQRQSIEPAIQAASEAKQQSIQHVRDIIGLFQQDIGQQKGDQSGVAIEKLQTAGDVATQHFFTNARACLKYEGRQLIDLIPKIYDTARQVRILRPESGAEVVWVNKQYIDEQGQAKFHDLTQGRYDVVVNTGPSETTKRQKAFVLLSKLAQAFPQIVQLAGDIIFRNSDVPGASQIADRLEKMLPPQLQPQANPMDLPPALMQQMQQTVAENQQLKQALASAQVDLKLQLSKAAADNASKERIAGLNNRVQLIKAELDAKNNAVTELFRGHLEGIGKQLDMLHETEMAPGAQGLMPGAQSPPLPPPPPGMPGTGSTPTPQGATV